MRSASVRLFMALLLMMSTSLAGRAVAHVNTLVPFTSDGCSMMLDGLPGDLPHWRHCCVAHDWDYWLGGSSVARAASDRRLQVCISEAASAMLGDFVYSNVRWGGSPYWITSYRWGYGWPYWDADHHQVRGYKILTDAEQEQVDALMTESSAVLSRELARYKNKAL